MSTQPQRCALVTGAAGGLGQAICRRLANAGWGLGLLDVADGVHAVAESLRADGHRVEAVQADLCSADAIADAVATLQARLGRPDGLDALVNNAGITNHIAPLTRMKLAGWQRELDVNLTAPFLLTQALLPGMVARGWGRIVNISSGAGRYGLFQQAGYSASKAGIIGLTRATALEHARHGISCNAVLPGLIETEAVAKIPAAMLDDALALVPARRTGRPDEIGALVAFLCSDDAGYLNGAELEIDGGGHLCPVVLGSAKEIESRRKPRA